MCRDFGGMTGAIVRLKQYDLSNNTITKLCVEFTVVYVIVNVCNLCRERTS